MSRSRFLLIALATLGLALVTIALFDRAYPLVDVGLRMSRDDIVAQARTIAARQSLAPPSARAAARFESNDTLSTYVDLAAGGADSLRALVRGRVLPVYTWAVRLYEPGSPREVVLRFAPSGMMVGFDRTLGQDEHRPTVSEAVGRAAADATIPPNAQLRFVSASYVTQPRSGRVDRSYTYEQPVLRVGAAPIRKVVRVTGDSARPDAATVLGVRTYADIPEAFLRRYGEMRSANDLYAAFTIPAMGVFLVAAMIALARLKSDGIRWRPAAWVGGVVGTLFLVAGLDGIPGAWFDYDTATSPTTFVAQLVLGAITSGVGAGLFVALVVAAAEALTRRALPSHYDWWGYWKHRGAPPIAARILGGYALAAFGFAYVTLFYIATRTLLGWWVPTGTLDDPNQIASPLPWASALGMSTFAGVWEESIFRAVPLALLTLWASRDAKRRRWIPLGIAITALVFGFGHANYQSWPAYSRGVELFAEATLWAVLYLSVGLPTTIVAHTLYDLTWFGLFSLHGTGTAYRVTFAIVLAAFLLPALAVAQGWLARRRAIAHGVDVAEPPRFADWSVGTRDAGLGSPAGLQSRPIPESRVPTPAPIRVRVASLIALVGLVVRIAWPRAEPLGPAFSASRERVVAAADSTLRARGANPNAWRRFATIDGASRGDVRRFLERAEGKERTVRALASLATSYVVTTWWDVRYAHTTGTVADRAEEWHVRVLPDGRVLDATRIVPELRPGASPSPDSARRVAQHALALAAIVRDSLRGSLREVDLEQTPRPARLDTRVEYEDAAVPLPGGASARTRVVLAGVEPLEVRRGVQLPEAFQRDERERASRRALVVALAAIAGLGTLVSCIVLALRRVPRSDSRTVVDRRVGISLGVVAGLASLASAANNVPSVLAAWPTVQPWSTYLTASTLSMVIAAGAAGVGLAALWTLTDALRRRTTIPFWPTTHTRDAAIAGAALGLGATGLQFAIARIAARGWPVPRSTDADRLVPWLDGALGVIPAALTVPTVAIVGLALVVATRRGAPRVALLALGAACAATISAAGADTPAVAAAVTIVGYAAVVSLATMFGGASGVSWVFAALAASVAGGVRAALVGETSADVVSGMLGTVVAIALGALSWRASSRRSRDHARDSVLPTGMGNGITQETTP